MAAIVRVIDDRIWDPSHHHWKTLLEHVTPIVVRLEHVDTTWCVQLHRVGVVNTPWSRLFFDKQRSATRVKADFYGKVQGRVVHAASAVGMLLGQADASLVSGDCPWVPEVVRIQFGAPAFLEVQLLTGKRIDWIDTWCGPGEDSLFGGEWDVLCLDMINEGTAKNFHTMWLEWHSAQGLRQAFRSVFLFTSSTEPIACQHSESCYSADALAGIPAFPGHGDSHLAQAREHLWLRATEPEEPEPLVLPQVEGARLLREARNAAELSGSILILGPSGTGKTALARLVHRWSGRAPSRFVYVNAGALTTDLGKDELYGHVKGAFTSADAPALGLLTRASKGTLFLDEIHHLEPERIQPLLLDVMDRQRFFPQGSIVPETVDLRIVCASNRPLDELLLVVKPDLGYRLFATQLRLPSVADYPDADFDRLVTVCWNRLKASFDMSAEAGWALAQTGLDKVVADEVEVSDGNVTLWGIGRVSVDDKTRKVSVALSEKISVSVAARGEERSDRNSYRAMKDAYEERCPSSTLYASVRFQEHYRNMSLSNDGRRFLREQKHQLRHSNARGLIAWLERALLQSDVGAQEISVAELERTSPVALRLDLVSGRGSTTAEELVSRLYEGVIADCEAQRGSEGEVLERARKGSGSRRFGLGGREFTDAVVRMLNDQLKATGFAPPGSECRFLVRVLYDYKHRLYKEFVIRRPGGGPRSDMFSNMRRDFGAFAKEVIARLDLPGGRSGRGLASEVDDHVGELLATAQQRDRESST